MCDRHDGSIGSKWILALGGIQGKKLIAKKKGNNDDFIDETC
jgi:hypothetical protein